MRKAVREANTKDRPKEWMQKKQSKGTNAKSNTKNELERQLKKTNVKGRTMAECERQPKETSATKGWQSGQIRKASKGTFTKCCRERRT